MKTTLRQLDKAIKKIADSHISVEDYFWGDWEDAFDDKVRKYPTVMANVSTPVGMDKITTIQLNLIAVDQVARDQSNLKEVESDTLQILHDFFKVMKYSPGWNNFCVVSQASAGLKFKDDSADEVAGWQVTLSLKLIETSGLCDIPLEGYDPTFPGPCITSYIVFNSDSSFTIEISNDYELPDTPVVVKDQFDNVLASESLPSVTGGEIQVMASLCVDGTAVLKDTLGNVISSTPVPSGVPVDVEAPDAEYELIRSDSSVISSGSLQSNDIGEIPVADSTVNVRKSDSTLISAVAVMAEAVTDYPVGDSEITLNMVPFFSVKATDSMDIELVDQNEEPLEDYSFIDNKITVQVRNPDRWKRDKNWLTLPEITSADDRTVGLFLVFEGGYNALNLSVLGSSLDVSLDWGDGSSVNILGSGSTVSHVYDYASLGGPVNTYKGYRNYKQVLVDINVASGSLTQLNLCPVTSVNNGGVNQFVDLSISHVNANTIQFSNANRRLLICERLAVYNHAMTVGANYEMSGMYSLRKLEFAFLGLTTIASEFTQLGNTDPFDIISSNLTSINSAISANTRTKFFGNIDCPNVLNASQFGINASNVEEIGTVNLPLCTNMSNFCSSMLMLRKIGLINSPANTTLSGFASNCTSIIELHFTDCSLVSVSTNLVTNCPSLEAITCPGMTVAFTVQGTAMGAAALLAMANAQGNWGGTPGTKTFTTIGTPGALDPAYIAVLNGKGYIVINA